MSDKKHINPALNNSDTLRRLMNENPDLPLMFLAGEDTGYLNATSVPNYIGWYGVCQYSEVLINEVLVLRKIPLFDMTSDFPLPLNNMPLAKDEYYIGKKSLRDRLHMHISEEWDRSDRPYERDGVEAEVDEAMKKYDPYWVRAIIVIVDNYEIKKTERQR